MLSDAEAWRELSRHGMVPWNSTDPSNLRRAHRLDENPLGRNAWHIAATRDSTDLCVWLKAQRIIDDLVDARDADGTTPLMMAVSTSEDIANWMIANFAMDVSAWRVDDDHGKSTVFSIACECRSFAFVQKLADMVRPEHLALPDENRHVELGIGRSPMSLAVEYNNIHAEEIVRLLVLRGAPVQPDDFSLGPKFRASDETWDYVNVLDNLRIWAEAELDTRYESIGCSLRPYHCASLYRVTSNPNSATDTTSSPSCSDAASTRVTTCHKRSGASS